jgi:hypothetical protein
VGVVVGNPDDNSTSVVVPAQPVFPPGDDGKPKVRAQEQVPCSAIATDHCCAMPWHVGPWAPPLPLAAQHPSPRTRVQITFMLPPGVGTNRALRVLVYPSYRVELASISDPIKASHAPKTQRLPSSSLAKPSESPLVALEKPHSAYMLAF